MRYSVVGFTLVLGLAPWSLAVASGHAFAPRVDLLRVGVSSVYDSNIDHEPAGLESYGVTTGIDARLKTHRRPPYLWLLYRGGYQTFSNSSRWDRWQNAAELGMRIPLGGGFRFEGTAGYNGRVTTEDRDLVNQGIFSPEIRFDSGPWTVSLDGQYRIRRYRTQTAYDETIWMGTAEGRYELRNGNRLRLRFRRETGESETPERSYHRSRLRLRDDIRISQHHTVTLSAERLWRTYPEYLVDLGATTGSRQDRRWSLRASWRITLSRRQDITLGYEFDDRTSNHPDKGYTAHRLELELRWPILR